MSRWTRILMLSLLPVAVVALGTAPKGPNWSPTQEAAPASEVDSPARTTHKKTSNPSAKHGATAKSTAGADASLNPQPIPPGHTKSARRKSAATTTDGSNGELRDTSTKTARRKSAATTTDGSNGELRDTSTKTARRKSAATTTDGSNGELRDTSTKSARRKSSAAKNSNGELRDPSSRKTSKTKLNTDGEIRHPSSKKRSAASSKANGNDKGIIFVGGKKTQKTQKTRT